MIPEVQSIVEEIDRCTNQMKNSDRQFWDRLHALKVELARVCGHKHTVHEWAWTRCLDCGATDISALFAFEIRFATSHEE